MESQSKLQVEKLHVEKTSLQSELEKLERKADTYFSLKINFLPFYYNMRVFI